MKKNNTIQGKNDDIHFITANGLTRPGEVQLHKNSGNTLTRKVSQVKEDWNTVMKQVSVIVSDTDVEMSETGYSLNEITISLGFNATGKLAFIAEAGVEASIEITFTRK